MECIASHVVAIDESGMQLRDCAAEVFIHIPKKGVRKAIRSGAIRLNGATVPSNTTVRVQDEITLWERPTQGPPFQHPLEILYQDDVMAVIDKPSGMLVSGNAHRTVQRALPFNLPKTNLPDALSIPRPVHRLDKGTSGVLVIARTVSALRHLSLQFEQQEVKKTYEAFVYGHLPGNGLMTEPIYGKKAETRYEVIRQLTSSAGNAMTHVRLHPRTGRTHQIRIHLTGLGHPVVGDTKYGSEGQELDRLMLHAARIELKHPEDGMGLVVEADLPAGFEAV